MMLAANKFVVSNISYSIHAPTSLSMNEIFSFFELFPLFNLFYGKFPSESNDFSIDSIKLLKYRAYTIFFLFIFLSLFPLNVDFILIACCRFLFINIVFFDVSTFGTNIMNNYLFSWKKKWEKIPIWDNTRNHNNSSLFQIVFC